LAVSKSLAHNRSLPTMMSNEKVVKWRDVEALLMEHYETGTNKEGANACPALMLGIMLKDTRGAKITQVEIKRNRKISKKRYIRFQPVGLTGQRVEQYFGLSHLHHGFQLVAPTARRERTVRAQKATLAPGLD
jgi:hypothetical protein